VKDGVTILFDEIYRKPAQDAKWLHFIDAKGGMGNQLQGLSVALVRYLTKDLYFECRDPHSVEKRTFFSFFFHFHFYSPHKQCKVVAACTGRRISVGSRSTGSIASWLWGDYFEDPLPGWHNSKRRRMRTRGRRLGEAPGRELKRAGAKGQVMSQFLTSKLGSAAKMEVVSTHHADLSNALRSDPKVWLRRARVAVLGFTFW